jgi:hypothetical protein
MEPGVVAAGRGVLDVRVCPRGRDVVGDTVAQMPTRTGPLAMVLLAAGCTPKPMPAAQPPTAIAEPEAGAPASIDPHPLDCGPEVRGAAALAVPGAVLLIGEMHGTTQAPEVVGRIACHAARTPGSDVILGVEITADNQPAVDAYLASDGAPPATAALLAAPHFASEMKDGRSSQAMLQLLDAVRRWRAAGASIAVVCFDAREGAASTSAERDAVMAEALVAAHHARPAVLLVTLSGNIHNRTVPGVPWDAAYVPMGVHMREAFPKLVSLDFRSAGGTFWACMGDPGGAVRCGTTKAGGEDRGPDPFVELHDARDDKGFDGVLYVGTTTASEPAVPAATTE